MKRILIEITPVPKPRQTQSDKWKKRPIVERYREYADKLREEVNELLPNSGIIMVFRMPMAKSWSDSKKELMNGQPHMQRPDLDNLVKGVLDALVAKDEQVWSFAASKYWAEHGSLEIILPEIMDEEDNPNTTNLN
jgi:Holliday junction resolvase RusA-like endonuclease